MSIIKKPINKAKEFLVTISYCLKISIKSSIQFFIVRIFIELLIAFIPFISILLGKKIINHIVDVVSSNNTTKSDVSVFINMLLILLALQFANRILMTVKESLAGLHKDLISKYISIQIGKKAVSLDLSYFDSTKFYNELTNAKRDSNVIKTLTWYVVDIVRSVFQLIMASILLFRLNILFALMLVITAVPAMIVQRLYTKKIYNWQIDRVPQERKMGYLMGILTSRGHAKNIRLFNIADHLLSNYNTLWSSWYKEKKKLIFSKSAWVGIISILPEIGTCIIMVYVGINILYGELTIGDYSLYMGIVSQMTAGLFIMINQMAQIYDNQMRFTRYSSFMKWNSRIENIGKEKLDSKLTIEFRNVSFKYPQTDNYVLKNLNLIINSNEKIALVGENGSGKSTIVKLVLRFYDPIEGSILINGIDVKEYDINQLRTHFTVLFQDYINYAFTIRENIGISSIDEMQDEDKIIDSCTKGNVDSILEKYETGLDTYLTREYEESGVELSGGQWQKISIARTFFRDGDMIILDEPSAALDPKAEDEIFKVFDEICKGKGAIFISHRLSNVVDADRIIYIEDGHVKEDGSHKELLLKDGKYAYLFNLQAKKYSKVI